jgi:ribonuclease D
MLITQSNELKAICQDALSVDRVGLDTEFVWERTYYPRLGIVQLALSPEDIFLIDAVALPQLDGLGEVLACPSVELILHDALQDLQILSRHTYTTPCNVFDTRRAAGFAGLESTISLANLLKGMLDVDIAKDETRSDWLQRPLSEAQAEYARADVIHLHALTKALTSEASARNNTQALHEEMQRYDEPSQYTMTSVDTLYNRIRTHHMHHETRAAIYALLCWREEEAVRLDRPRKHILQDAQLMEIANQLTSKPAGHVAIPKRHASAIHDTLRKAKELTTEDIPETPQKLRLSAGQKKAIESRRKLVNERAIAAQIDPALVANKAEITSLVLHELGDGPPAPAHLTSGWRTNLTAPDRSSAQQGQLSL